MRRSASSTGLTGALFREFAFTLAGAVIVSGVIALTLSPMMCSKLLKPTSQGGRLRQVPRPQLRAPASASISAGFITDAELPAGDDLPARLSCVMSGCGLMYHDHTEGTGARGGSRHSLRSRQVAAIRQSRLSRALHRRVDKVFAHRPGKAECFRHQRLQGVHSGFRRHPVQAMGRARAKIKQQILQDLQPKLASVAGVQVFPFAPPSLPGTTGGPPVQFVITTTARLRAAGAGARKDATGEAQKSGLFIFTDGDLRFDTPQVELKIDHDKANRLGITMAGHRHHARHAARRQLCQPLQSRTAAAIR